MKVLCPDVAVPSYNKNPKMRFALMENLNRALEMVEEGGIKTVGIGIRVVSQGEGGGVGGLHYFLGVSGVHFFW